MRKLRISAISFLNTAPLMWDFEHGEPPYAGQQIPPELARDFKIEHTVPSRCADALRAGTADLGIIPAVEFARIPELVILPDVAIAAKNPVRSILLITNGVPLDQVRTVAADTSSRTSVALTRVLFHLWFRGVPELVPAEPQLGPMLSQCDAALLIGDAALAVDCSQHRTWDLAEEWQRLTGKPFVFAFWAMRMVALKEMRQDLDIARVFRDSRDRGLEPKNLEAIAREWTKRLPMNEQQVISYLTRNIHYRLDQECLSGLELFLHHAAECGALTHAPSLRFLAEMPCAVSAL